MSSSIARVGPSSDPLEFESARLTSIARIDHPS
jgi:hypothetical protein